MAASLSFAESGFPQPEHVLSVSELSGQIKDVLDGVFASVWVCGEISNFSRPSSGHCYFTLKDSDAQLRAVLWKSAATRARFELADGLQVLCRGRIDLYPPRGSYQLVIDRIEPLGLGALERAFIQLRDRLAAEGLFALDRKRPLPRYPRRIALVTSPTGAAIRDFLEVLRRRWCGADVLLAPVRVQGDGAAAEIAAAIRLVNALPLKIDLLVVGRGGGSLEDLWAFNEEAVVRAIYESRIPVVSAVGHEIDVTLADLVADVRAATPSEAAERVAPALEDVRAALDRQRQRLLHGLRSRLESAKTRVNALSQRRVLKRPQERLERFSQRLDNLEARSRRGLLNRLERAKSSVAAGAARLESLSPLNVLSRGYSLAFRQSDSAPLLSIRDLKPGELILTQLAEGRIRSQVISLDHSE